jgi:hypothetical protein
VIRHQPDLLFQQATSVRQVAFLDCDPCPERRGIGIRARLRQDFIEILLRFRRAVIVVGEHRVGHQRRRVTGTDHRQSRDLALQAIAFVSIDAAVATRTFERFQHGGEPRVRIAALLMRERRTSPDARHRRHTHGTGDPQSPIQDHWDAFPQRDLRFTLLASANRT